MLPSDTGGRSHPSVLDALIRLYSKFPFDSGGCSHPSFQGAPIRLYWVLASDYLIAPTLDWHMHLGESELAQRRKRAADVEDAVVAVSDRIAAAKRRRKSTVDPARTGSVLGALNGDGSPSEDREKLLKYPPITGYGWVGVSSPAAMERGYLRHRMRRHRATPKSGVEWAQEVDHQFGDMLETLRNEQRLRQRQQEEPEIAAVGAEGRDEEVRGLEPAGAQKSASLWLDKYAPRHFMDLLSDDVSGPQTCSFGAPIRTVRCGLPSWMGPSRWNRWVLVLPSTEQLLFDGCFP